MNFFEGKIVKSDNKLLVDTGDFKVEIPKERSKTLLPYAGKKIDLGIRPEDIYNPKFPVPGIKGALVDCEVDLLELMGNEIYVYLLVGKQNFVARVDARSNFKAGDKVKVVFDTNNFHFFDPEKNKDNPPAIR